MGSPGEQAKPLAQSSLSCRNDPAKLFKKRRLTRGEPGAILRASEPTLQDLDDERDLRIMQSDRPDVKEVTSITEPSHDEIALRAYELWEERGRAHGSDQDDWYLAGQQLRAV